MLCPTLPWNPDRTIALCAVLVALLALVIALWQAFLQRRTMRLQIFENTFREIRDQEVKFTEDYMLPLIDLEKRLKSPTTNLANPEESVQITDMFRTLNHVRHLRTFSFFNTVEYLAFLINKGFVSDTRLESFFGPAFVFWYEELLRKHDEVAEKDPKKYEEFKKLYRRLKGKSC
jgi:hypothetical protein